jgi:hypothetical protein
MPLIPRNAPLAGNLTSREVMVKATLSNGTQKVFNSFVEKFVEKAEQNRDHPDKH